MTKLRRAYSYPDFKTYNKLHRHPPWSYKKEAARPLSCDVDFAGIHVHHSVMTQRRVSTARVGEPSARNNTGPPLRPRELGRLSKSSRCLVRPAPCDTVVGTEQLSRSRNAHQASSFPFDPEVADSEMRGGQGQVSTGAVATMESGHSLSLARPRRCGRRAVGLLKHPRFQRRNTAEEPVPSSGTNR